MPPPHRSIHLRRPVSHRNGGNPGSLSPDHEQLPHFGQRVGRPESERQHEVSPARHSSPSLPPSNRRKGVLPKSLNKPGAGTSDNAVMMGAHQPQKDLFNYQVNLDKRVRPDNALRRVNAVLDLSFVRPAVAPFYGHNGHVGTDPVILVKMMLLLFLDDVPSERE